MTSRFKGNLAAMLLASVAVVGCAPALDQQPCYERCAVDFGNSFLTGQSVPRRPRNSRSSLKKAPKALAPTGVAELSKRLGFDLADALAGDVETLSDLFEGVVALLTDAKAQP